MGRDLLVNVRDRGVDVLDGLDSGETTEIDADIAPAGRNPRTRTRRFGTCSNPVAGWVGLGERAVRSYLKRLSTMPAGPQEQVVEGHAR